MWHKGGKVISEYDVYETCVYVRVVVWRWFKVCLFLHSDGVHQDKDALLRMLMEAEVNGAAAAKQASALRESIFNLCAPGSSVSITSGSALSMCPVRLGEHGNFRKKQKALSVFHDAVFLSLCLCCWRSHLAPSLQPWPVRTSCCCRNWRHLRSQTEHCGSFSESSMNLRYYAGSRELCYKVRVTH